MDVDLGREWPDLHVEDAREREPAAVLVRERARVGRERELDAAGPD